MVFSSLPFMYCFFPALLLVYYLTQAKYRSYILLLGSLIFYAAGCAEHPEYLLLLLFVTGLDFGAALLMEQKESLRRPALFAAVFFHLTFLIYYKYSAFLVNDVFKSLSGGNFTALALPLGISFYTFSGLSYVIDVYRKKTAACRELTDFACYMVMFPKLTAGPIASYKEMKSDLTGPHKLSFGNFADGLETFLIGLGLKVILANQVGGLWTQAQNVGFDSISTPFAWLAIFAYSFQLYFDFYGYSLMAMGIGQMLGFKIPVNFDHPYITLTMTDFWRHWHMTLAAWFKEYIYIPLGGNRKGKARTWFNMFVVWILTGVWHGAGWNFILWGFTLFVIMVIEKQFLYVPLHRHHIIGHIYMTLLIPLTWALFAITSGPSEILLFFERLFPFFGQGFFGPMANDWLAALGTYGKFLLAAVLFSTELPLELWKILKERSRLAAWIILFVILIFSTWCLKIGLNDPFLYFSF